MSNVIDVGLLGPIKIAVNGAPPPPEALWRKHLAVALYLWVHSERPVPRDRLLGLLWPESDESSARHSLNEALRVLRLAYGREGLESTAESVQWVGPVTLDVEAYTRLSDEDPLAAAAFVRGGWCDGLVVPGAGAFDEWLTLERERWRGRVTATLTRAAGMFADRANLDAALQYANRASALSPWDDAAARTLMRLRALTGDRAGAIAAGRTHAMRLHEDLDAVPAAATRALLSRLSEGVDPGQGGTATWVGRPVQPPLLHRERLLEEGVDLWRRISATGTGATICWVGSPGSGRSRILEECSNRARLEGARVATIHAVPNDGTTREDGLHAIADALVTNIVGLGGADPAAIGTLAQLRPRWAEQFPAVPQGELLDYVDALVSVLGAASEDAPIVIAIDDLDRFHPEGIHALTVLARALHLHRVTFLVTTAAESEQRTVREFVRLPGTSLPGVVLALPPLDEAHLLALVEWSQPDWDSDARARLARRLDVEAGASLFAAVELLGAIREGLALPDAPSVWPAPERTLDATLPAELPTALLMALRHRWQRCASAEQQILQLVALGAEPIGERCLAELCDGTDQIEPVLDRLEESQWLTSDNRGYRFASRTLRRFVADDTMTPGQRRRVQARVGG